MGLQEKLSVQSTKEPNSTLQRFLTDVVEDLGLTSNDKEVWMHGLRDPENCSHVVAALLLLHAPNITHLDAGGWWDWAPFVASSDTSVVDTPKWWEAAFRHRSPRAFACRLRPSYAHLHSIRIWEVGFVFPQAGPLFRLPALRHLHLVDIEELDGRESWTWDPTAIGFEEGASPVEDLRIEGCQVHVEALAVMVGSCKALKGFTYELAEAFYWGHGPRFERDLSALGDALSKHTRTLKGLSVHNTGKLPRNLHWGPLLGLNKLSNLESATLDGCALFYASNEQMGPLPRSLRNLRMENIGRDILDLILGDEGFALAVMGEGDGAVEYIRMMAKGERLGDRDKEIIMEFNAGEIEVEVSEIIGRVDDVW